MKSTDKEAFGIAFTECMTVYEKTVTPALLAVWFASLQGYPLAAVQVAFGSYITDPKDCRFTPKPGDIIRHIELAGSDDGRPGVDEAWGILLRVIGDERETGVLTDEMRIGWTAGQPILDLGDEVGARLAFRETYTREVERARKMAVAPRWTPTLGTDPTLRQSRLREAVEARRIGVDTVRALLPGPTPHQIAQVAGLLGGPDASDAETQIAASLRQTAQILHQCNPAVAEKAIKRAEAIAALPPDQRPAALAAMVRTGLAESEQRRTEERQQQRESEAAKKAAIRELLDRHQRNNDSGQAAA